MSTDDTAAEYIDLDNLVMSLATLLRVTGSPANSALPRDLTPEEAAYLVTELANHSFTVYVGENPQPKYPYGISVYLI